MALFQKAPQSAEDLKGSEPLDIPPAEVAEIDEAEWYAKAYRGDSVPQLTVRAIVMGSVLVTTGFFVLSTLVSDIINALLDPRLRERQGGGS